MKNADVSRTQGPHSKWMWLKSFSLTYPVEGGSVLNSFLLFFGEWGEGGGEEKTAFCLILSYTGIFILILLYFVSSCLS